MMMGVVVSWWSWAMAAQLQAVDDPQALVGGTEAGVCEWPTAVAVGGCSGTLIHPEVVIYAAHCGAGATQVAFGETSTGARVVATSSCATNPAFVEPGGDDFAYCVLAEPVTDLAIAPILMGCELQLLAPDVMLTTLGFGGAPDGPSGIKRWVEMPIDQVFLDTAILHAGGDGVSLCGGDSGGGSFVRYLDGSWRLVGVSSATIGTPCTDAQALLAMPFNGVEWIESSSGIDVTPCHDADGTWNPGASCQGFAQDPATGVGDWPSCGAAAVSGYGSSCGAPSGGPDDVTAPSVSIVMPGDGTVFPLVGDTAEVLVTLDVTDEGWGLSHTLLRIDGVDVPGSIDDFPPFEVPALDVPEGAYELVAVAVDWAGNEGVSAMHAIVVGDPPMSTTGLDGTGSTDAGETSATSDGSGDASGDVTQGLGTSSTGDAPGSDSSGTPAAEGDGSSCACTLERRATIPWLVVLLALTRRRARPTHRRLRIDDRRRTPRGTNAGWCRRRAGSGRGRPRSSRSRSRRRPVTSHAWCARAAVGHDARVHAGATASVMCRPARGSGD